jgi:hypothetical protein
MFAGGICIVTFCLTFVLGRRALWTSFVGTMVVGYSYGILRANIQQPASHFIFDAAASGMYLAAFSHRFTPPQKYKLRPLVPWSVALIAWPAMLLLVPGQDPLIRLVGLRGQTFFVPLLLIGASLSASDFTRIARSTAMINCAVTGVALLQTKLGIASFYPHNAVDEIIYNSRDVLCSGIAYYRIPATFTSSAAYAGTMVISAPLLLGAMAAEPRKGFWRYILLIATGLSAIGVFLAASRSAAMFEMVMTTLFLPFGRAKSIPIYGWIGVFIAVILLVSVTPRMQRFVTLSDAHFVGDRLSSSVNTGLIDIVEEYPLGNGLGGGGASIPYFLQSRANDEVSVENEYGLIALEQGLPGLVIWLAFICWLLIRPIPRLSDPWYTGRWLARIFCALSFATAPLGNGMLSAIPQTAILMLYAGWISAPQNYFGNVSSVHGRYAESKG